MADKTKRAEPPRKPKQYRPPKRRDMKAKPKVGYETR